ncbi:MAG TPA: peptidoglycan recognition family protein [Polyangiaceae bacterium]|nr:peptidoglycan recognition family protein [Polyangiaceae bacterium]
MHAIIVRGESVRIDAPTRTWHEHGLKFDVPMRSTTRAVMNHWTGAENSPRAVFENLKRRTNVAGKVTPLSVQFVIDQMGEIWQLADTDARCQHAGAIANGWSIGIEYICRGHNKTVPTRGIVREQRHETVHGRSLTYAALTPEQIASGVELNETLCRVYELPLRVPMLKGEVYSTVLPAPLIASYQGVLGHFQVDLNKVDPALELLAAIHQRGLARQLPVA